MAWEKKGFKQANNKKIHLSSRYAQMPLKNQTQAEHPEKNLLNPSKADLVNY